MKNPTLSICLLILLSGYTFGQGKAVFKKSEITSVMNRVAHWQLANPVSFNSRNENDWARSAFYTGIMAAYETTGDAYYLDAAMKWANDFDWKLANRLRHADDHARGQTYLDLYAIRKDEKMISDTKNTFDSLINNPKAGREDWWWCDALFMAPPVLSKLYKSTGDDKYLKFLNTMFWDTYDFLYDKEEHLFYRDKGYFDKKTPNGSKTFWARGNGWVMAGTIRVLQCLSPADPGYQHYVTLLQEMAGSVRKIQGKDGLWRPSLLDAEEVPHPETSASAFFCYALAWGVNNQLLDAKVYTPVVKNAWKGLNQYVTKEGKLQWVQPIGASPDKVTQDNFQEYGSGAFLLAGSEVIKLK